MQTRAREGQIAAQALLIITLYFNFTGVCASSAPAESGTFEEQEQPDRFGSVGFTFRF
jgi:hypothetical protein